MHYKVYKFGIPKERKVAHFYKHDGQLPCAFKGCNHTPLKLCLTHHTHHTHSDDDNNNNHCDEKMDIRQNRFPSVEERVKYYMGHWYSTTNKRLFTNDFYETFLQNEEDGDGISSSNSSSTDADADADVMDYQKSITGRILINPYGSSPVKMYKFYALDWKKHKSRDRNAKNYIRDFIDFSIIYNSIKSTTPVIFHHIDGLSSANPKKELTRKYPVFGKVRDTLAENNNVNHWRCSSTKGCRQCGLKHSNIIWPLNRRRHYSAVASVPKNDIPFDQKIGMAVWRGRIEKSDLVDADLPIEISSWKQRMALVGNHINSTYVNAKFPPDDYVKTSKSLTKQYVGSILHMSDMLKYKYLVAIEGNDVSSGLKWMLFSNSVVFIPQPITWESWAMESLLQPFVHYTPTHANVSNIEEMIVWCEDNPKKVQHISKRSTLFICDLLFHPDSYMDEEQILVDIVKKYDHNFGSK